MQPIVKTLVFVVAITFFALVVPRVQANSLQVITQTSGFDLTKPATTILATEKGFFTGLTGKFGSASSHNTTVPERATLLLLGSSLAGFATAARRRATRLKRAR